MRNDLPPGTDVVRTLIDDRQRDLRAQAALVRLRRRGGRRRDAPLDPKR